MNLKKNSLSKQLLLVVGIAFVLLFISLGVVLPRVLIPVAEQNIYSYLSEPLKIYDNDVDNKLLNTEIAYIYISDNTIATSTNIEEVIKYENLNSIIKKITKSYGKFLYNNNKYYYYYKLTNEKITKIALANDNYINKTKTTIISAIFPSLLATFLLIGLMIVYWSSLVVRKIEKLKSKIDNIDNPSYNHKIDFIIDDEIRSLALALEDMRITLVSQEKYRNQMYQNISHDFKTPITVIESYIEAVEDGVEEKDRAFDIIKTQTQKLEQKVHSLLYLNKLDYLKNTKPTRELVNMEKMINDEVNKFKFHRKNLKFEVFYDKKAKYYGSIENWETILDNILSNFIRYAETTIKITAKPNKIILYNDGEQIDDDFLEVIFTPFRKGIKGEFGLGLSIVKKTLNIMGYDIIIRNEKKGVSFIIISQKKTHR